MSSFIFNYTILYSIIDKAIYLFSERFFKEKIPVNVIKDAVEIIAKPFAIIFNSSMDEGVFPGTPIYNE